MVLVSHVLLNKYANADSPTILGANWEEFKPGCDLSQRHYKLEQNKHSKPAHKFENNQTMFPHKLASQTVTKSRDLKEGKNNSNTKTSLIYQQRPLRSPAMAKLNPVRSKPNQSQRDEQSTNLPLSRTRPGCGGGGRRMLGGEGRRWRRRKRMNKNGHLHSIKTLSIATNEVVPLSLVERDEVLATAPIP